MPTARGVTYSTCLKIEQREERTNMMTRPSQVSRAWLRARMRRTAFEAVMRRSRKKAVLRYRQVVSEPTTMPDFIVIGAMRSGTSSFFGNLGTHPRVCLGMSKEVHFFDLNYQKGLSWYAAHFPSEQERSLHETPGQAVLTGEATPYYLFHPHVPRRVFEHVPRVKLIALLRNPIDRAYSHYFHQVRKGQEPLPFADAIAVEEERLHLETKRMLSNENHYSFEHHNHSYLSRGIYVDQLANWLAYFPREQLLVLKSEDYYASPVDTLNRTAEFLGLPHWNPLIAGPASRRDYAPMDQATRTHLVNFFEPHNRRLYDLLGLDLGWA